MAATTEHERLQMEVAPITYYPVSMQKQFASNRDVVAGTPYAPYLTPDLEVPVSWAKALERGPLPQAQTLSPSIADLNRFFDAFAGSPEDGYAVIEGPTAYVQSHTVLPGVTTEMFQWWYIWSSLAKEHFLLWFPYAHIDAFVEDPKRLADQSLSFEERLYHNRSHYEQYVGPALQKVIMEYRDPTQLGLDAAMLKREGITASTSSIASLAAAPDVTTSLILHLARDTEGGMELFSRFWIGGHPEFKRFPGGDRAAAAMAQAGLGQDKMENLAYEMAVHDMTEFAHLTSIVPQLYERFGTATAA